MTTGRITIIHHKELSPSFVMFRKAGEEQAPRTLLFYLLRGRIYFAWAQYDKAARDFRTVLRMDWRHEQAAAWLERAERASRPPVDGGDAHN